jgi:gas vesicle protein
MVMRFFIGFLLGFIIGASVALALAPQPGVETRAKVLERMRERTQGTPFQEAISPQESE